MILRHGCGETVSRDSRVYRVLCRYEFFTRAIGTRLLFPHRSKWRALSGAGLDPEEGTGGTVPSQDKGSLTKWYVSTRQGL